MLCGCGLPWAVKRLLHRCHALFKVTTCTIQHELQIEVATGSALSALATCHGHVVGLQVVGRWWAESWLLLSSLLHPKTAPVPFKHPLAGICTPKAGLSAVTFCKRTEYPTVVGHLTRRELG